MIDMSLVDEIAEKAGDRMVQEINSPETPDFICGIQVKGVFPPIPPRRLRRLRRIIESVEKRNKATGIATA